MFKTPASLLLSGLITLPLQATELPLMHGMEIGDELSLPTQLEHWLISEKYDGVRAYWDGQRLMTRNGYPIKIPEEFTRNWPRQHLEGELWIGYGQFSRLAGLIQQHQPPEQDWQAVRFMLFDLPQWPGTFVQRSDQLAALVKEASAPNLKVIKQHQGLNTDRMEALLRGVVDRGGEGLMLHRGQALYQLQRSSDIRKLKPCQDADAQVLAHLPGKGKYSGMMGSLLVQLEDGSRFKIGTGFTDAERASPPPEGSTITFRYNGLTTHGKPRFARFLRIRPD